VVGYKIPRAIASLFASLKRRWRRGANSLAGFRIDPDDLFIVSYPRSGNTWVRFLLANLMQYDRGEAVDFHSVHERIPDLEIAAHRQRLQTMAAPRMIKTHRLPDPRLARVIYLLRDGRDVMVSYFHFLRKQGRFEGDFLTFLQQDARPRAWQEHVTSWLEAGPPCDLLLVRYEDLVLDTAAELTKMARFAGLPCEPERFRFSIEHSSFEEMRAIERQKGRAFGPQGKDFQFVRKGMVGDWREAFEAPHKALFKKQANRALIRFGYAEHENW